MEINSDIFNIRLQLLLGSFQKDIEINLNSFRLGIMGPSGCGKSSLARAIAGINHHFQGEFKFRGKSYEDIKAWDRNFAYLPQDIQLVPHLSVKKNILFPKKSHPLPEVIAGLEIGHLMHRMPRNLSGGEKQKIGLARALCANSELLILDEPFSSLDWQSKQNTIDFLSEFALNRNLPMIVISHGKEDLITLNCSIYSLDIR